MSASVSAQRRDVYIVVAVEPVSELSPRRTDGNLDGLMGCDWFGSYWYFP